MTADLKWPNGLDTIPRITSEYGLRFHPVDHVWRLHGGIDEVGFSTVCSPVRGVVEFTRYYGGWGNLVKVREHATGDVHWLAHNARFLVAEGTEVWPGSAVAIQGTTGSSTGVHTHHEVRIHGVTTEPRAYYTGRNASSAGGGDSPFNPAPTPTPAPKPRPNEDDEMLAIHVNDSGTAHTVTLAPGVLSHMIPSDNPDNVKNQVRSNDDWTECTVDEFNILLARHGVDLGAYRFIDTTSGENVGPGRGGQLVVLNAATGQWWMGQTWNRSTVEANRVLSELKPATA